MFFRKRSVYTGRVRRESPECKTMKEELAAVEQYGAELGEQSPNEAYMFNKEEEVNMDAFCGKYLDKQKLGASSDAASYFGELSSRFGFDCRAEGAKDVASVSTPASVPASSPADNVSTS